jgi:crotonobetainyl-CoA:carnitine CoA-transferase CaiB-like acyl-CoA transferase
MGIEELFDDPRFADNDRRREHREELIPILEDIFVTRPGDEWLRRLSNAGVPCGPINTLDLAFSEPQVEARDMLVEMHHAKAGRLRSIGDPVKASPMDDHRFEPAPLLGQHSDEVLRGILGYSPQHIAMLREEAIIG